MSITSKKESAEILGLVRVLESAGRTGIDLSKLSARVYLPSSRIEFLLKKYEQYFVRVGDTRQYALNRFGRFHGSAKLIAADIERSYKTYLLSMSGAIIAMIIAIVAAVV